MKGQVLTQNGIYFRLNGTPALWQVFLQDKLGQGFAATMGLFLGTLSRLWELI